jgi:CRISPR-associated endonuclease/helicase Cas3
VIKIGYYAHYDKEKNEKNYLKDHLNSVGNLVYQQIPPTVNFNNISNELIKEISYCIGMFHDLGKYSNYFQEYLINGIDSHLKNHAHISACYTYSYLSKKLEKCIQDIEHQKILTFLCYLCIRLHHTSLRRDGLFSYAMWNDLKILQNHFIEKANTILDDIDFQNKMNLEEFCTYFDIESLEKNKRYLEYMPVKFQNGRINNPKWYFLLIYLFSLLIDLDKLDAAYLSPRKIELVSPENVIIYLKTKHGDSNKNLDLNNRREEARNSMLQVINKLTDEDVKNVRFFTLTAPTGIGKTLSSLQSALRLQERIHKVEGYIPRIITAIPFINIIEQNKDEYKNVFGEDARMVVHHRLSDFSSHNLSKEEIPIDKALLETESWEGDVILTTFVQLFQSIFTGENRLLKKINKLAGSIVILDEAQAIPECYMPLIGATLQMMAAYYGTRFILMTATQPKILEFGNMLFNLCGIKGYSNKKVELLPNHHKYFEGLNRTKFVPLLNEKLDTEEFIELFFEKWPNSKSTLIVVNTIKRSIEIYKEIINEVKLRKYNVPVYYLSTNIIPTKRKAVIKEVKSILDTEQPVILVSTQTIEAGVDMDFDIAFRDFAPLDSLIQTAGRVNREGKKGRNLPVYIVQLEKDTHYVYKLTHRQSTVDLLMEKEEIMENEYGKLIDKYYNLALDRGVSDESRIIWQEGIVKLDFDALKKFQLIDNIGEVCDVFIEMDDIASSLADAYEEVLKYEDEINLNILLKVFNESHVKGISNQPNIFERKALLKLIMSRMSDYIVQIRISRLKGNRPIEFVARGDVESNLYWVPPGQLSEYYDENTGFIDERGMGYII